MHNLPPLVAYMVLALQTSINELKARITQVRQGKLKKFDGKLCQTVQFKFDGKLKVLPLRNRLAEVVVGINRQADKKIAILALLDAERSDLRSTSPKDQSRPSKSSSSRRVKTTGTSASATRSGATSQSSSPRSRRRASTRSRNPST
jgi:hypothetical protein